MARRSYRLTADGRKKYKPVPRLKAWLRLFGDGEQGARDREAFAKRVGTSLPYLVHVVYGNRRVSMELAVRIEKETHGYVKAEELHPSADWDYLKRKKTHVAATA